MHPAFPADASAHGREWNANQIGKSLGLSYHPANSYLDYLVGAFLFRRLDAWHASTSRTPTRS